MTAFLFRIKPKADEDTNPSLGISVVICAHNESEDLKQNLPKVLEQDYSNFEVLVVNDGSEDTTQQVLEEIKAKYSLLRILEISPEEKAQKGKKQALKMGIDEAKNNIVLLTDADCWPNSKRWIAKMARHYENESVQIVLGYSPVTNKQGWLNKIIRYDHFFTGVLYLNFAQAHKPYMGVGRNMSYRKNVHHNFDPEISLKYIGGDDDLLINQMATGSNTKTEIDEDAWVYTNGKTSWEAYYKQKRRHYSVGSAYRKEHQFLLLSWNITKLLLYILFPLVFACIEYQRINLFLMLLYLIFLLAVAYRNGKVLGKMAPLHLVPLLDVISVFFNSFVVLTGLMSKDTKWR